MKCIAIDDEPVALTIIKRYCDKIEGINLQSFTNPIEGMKCVKETVPDILFLDIEMGDVSGVELAKDLPKGTNLIFTTAYANFAIDGFDLNAVDFLHKPFSFSRFEKSIERVKKLMLLKGMVENNDNDDVFLKLDYKNLKLKISEIQYLEAMDNYVKIHLIDGLPIVPQIKLKGLLELLPKEKFIRIHKSYAVPIQKISSYTRKQVTIYHKSIQLPVGRAFADSLIERMSNIQDKNSQL